MASKPLRIVFVPAERRGSGPAVVGFISGLVGGLLDSGSGSSVVGSGGITVGTIERYPEVVVLNAADRRYVVDVMDTDEEAEQCAALMEADLQTLDIAEWCKRFSVPLSFAEEH